MEATSDFKYLQKLNFDPAQYKTFVYRLISNFRSVALIIMLIIGMGLYFFFNLPKELSPEINIPIASVSVTLSGASPKDIEKIIIEPLEKAISPLEDVDYLRSTANQSFAIIVVYLKDGVDPNRAVDELRTEIESVELPEDSTDPQIQTIDFSEVPVLQTSIVSELDLLTLSKIATDIKEELENTSAIRKVELNGQLEERIYLTLKLENIQKYNITPAQLINTLNSSNINLPSGNFEMGELEYQIAVDNSINSISDIRELLVNISGQSIPITELAEIRLNPDPDFKNALYFVERGGKKQNSIELRIYKTSDAKIDEAVAAADDTIGNYLDGQKNVKKVDISNEAQNITDQFNDLTNNFIGTIGLVFLVLFVFLGIKQAGVASISIPFTFLATFIIMGAAGLTINFLSLFSLLLALGLVVDNAIVIVSGYTMYVKSGKFNSTEAALMVYKDFKIPILTTTLTTVWAFLPLLLSTGIIGEYIRSIPIVVSASLIASASVAVFINLPLMAVLSNKVPQHIQKATKLSLAILIIVATYNLLLLILNQSPNPDSIYIPYLKTSAFICSLIISSLIFKNLWKFKLPTNINPEYFSSHILNNGILNFDRVVDIYIEIIRKILFSRTKKIMVIIVTLSLMFTSFGFVGTGLLKSEFFPKSDSELIYVNFSGPAGWNSKQLEPHINQAVDIIKDTDELKFMTIIQGLNIEADQDLSSGNNLAYIIIRLVEKESRKITSMDITDDLRQKLTTQLGIDTSVIQFSGGPPAGADIELNILGDDLTILEELNNKFIETIQSFEEVTNVESTLIQSSGQISIDLSSTELAKRQLNAQEVSFWLRSVMSGSEVTEILGGAQGDTKIFVNVDKTYTLADIENLLIPSASGNQYSLAEVAEIKLENTPATIDRKDGKRLISVLGYVAKDESATVVYNTKIKPALEEIELPNGYSWDIGGVNEQNQESVNSIISQMLLSFGLILTTMVLQMNSFRKALLVLSIIPVAISGVFFNFTLFGIPLSFPALIGVLALFGIVVNNTILLIDKISQNHKIGLEYLEGIIDACSSRLQPIFFTTATTIAGLLPITLSDPLWQGLGGAIIAGLSFSGVIILFLLPVAYSWIFKKTQ